MKDIPEELLNPNEWLVGVGITIGKLYTDYGLPIDVSIDRIHAKKSDKMHVLNGACQWLIEHKRLSGATENAMERQRKANLKMLEDFINTGETNIY